MFIECVNQKSKTIYISGAITGTDDFLKRFGIAEQLLIGQGYEKVINPAAVCSRLPKLKYEEYMSVCLTMLTMSDAIYMLKGYEQSRGANLELKVAIINGKQVMYE